MIIIYWLVVWNMFYFSILGIIIPTDLHIFQRGWNHFCGYFVSILQLQRKQNSENSDTQTLYTMRAEAVDHPAKSDHSHQLPGKK